MTSIATQLHARLATAIRRHSLLRPGDTVIVAVSAGADSTALLHLLATLPGYDLHLVAAHLNHSLRGAESDGDAEHAWLTAAALSIPFESRTVNVKSLARTERLNLEDAGRRARIAFLDELRQTQQAACVALAHHGDDQAETMLMRLLRGSGPTGLAAMAWRNGRGYIRPMLEISRAEIEAYLTEQGITWREDASNSDTAFLRNRIRHELLPLLAQYNPAIRESLTSTAAILARENDLLNQLALDAWQQQAEADGNTVTFSVARLSSLHPALILRLFRHAIAKLAGDLRHLNSRHLDACLALLEPGAPNRSIDLPRGMQARREYDRLLIDRQHQVPQGFTELNIPGPGSYRLDTGATLEIDCQSPPTAPRATPPDTIWIDLNQAPFPWLLRPFAPGDRLRPLGMTGAKKVKEIFIEAKLPPTERRRTPLLFCNQTLLWVCGLRRSAEAVLIPESRDVVRVRLIVEVPDEELDIWQREEIRKGLDEMRAGKLIDHDDVVNRRTTRK